MCVRTSCLLEYTSHPTLGILPSMKKKRKKSRHPPDGYVLLPGVTHPQGRARAFADAMKALVRGMIEINGNPTACPLYVES